MIVYIESLSPLYEFCIVCCRELAPCTVGLTWRRVYGDDIQRFGIKKHCQIDIQILLLT